jgi:hypothetical protein
MVVKNVPSYQEGWVSIGPSTVRESAAHHVVETAQTAANTWGNRADTLLTYAVGLWMFSYISLYASAMALKFAAAVVSHQTAEAVVTSPFTNPVTATAEICTRVAVTTASLAKETLAAQFEGENPDYRPTIGDVAKAVSNVGITNVVFKSQQISVGA